MQQCARQAFIDYHPGPADATAAYAEEAMRRAAGSPEAANNDRVSTTVTHIESPSVQIAWRLRMKEIGINLPFVPFFEAIQQPDPRMPKGQVEFVAWQYEGTNARPAFGQPDQRAADVVAALARQRFHLPTWGEQAMAIGQQWGGEWAQQFVAVMLDPPPAPEHIHPLDWVPRVQLAAALIVAFTNAGFKTLQSLALGPVDWIVDAAIIAFGEVALRYPKTAPSAVALFEQLRSQIPKEGFTCYAYPLACTWIRITPPHDPRRAELIAWRERILNGEEGGTTSSGCIGVCDGVNMEDYAEFCVKQEMLQAKGQSVAALAAEYGLDVLSSTHTYSAGWNESINDDPRLGLAFEQTKARIKLSMQGIDPDSEEARLGHALMAGKGLDQEEEMRKAQAAQQQMQAGGGEPDPLVFPNGPVAKLSDYVGMMKRMQTGDMNGAMAAYGLDMATYSQVMQAWGLKLASDPGLNAKFGQMMA